MMTDQDVVDLTTSALIEARIIRRVGECVIGNLEDEICCPRSHHLRPPRRIEAREFDPDAEFTAKDVEVAKRILEARQRL